MKRPDPGYIPRNVPIDKNAVLCCLQVLADREYQRRVWVEGVGPEVSSYGEVVCQLFNDTGLSLEMDKKREVFGPDIDQRLAELDKAISRVDGSISPAAMLDHPHMCSIRTIASDLVQKLSTYRSV